MNCGEKKESQDSVHKLLLLKRRLSRRGIHPGFVSLLIECLAAKSDLLTDFRLIYGRFLSLFGQA